MRGGAERVETHNSGLGEVLPKDLREKFVLVTLFDPRVKRKDMDVHPLGCGRVGTVLRLASGDRICLSL